MVTSIRNKRGPELPERPPERLGSVKENPGFEKFEEVSLDNKSNGKNHKKNEKKYNLDNKTASITHTLVRVFICCGIPFSIIENPFFIEFLHKMRLGYESPTSELLSGRFLNQETARINDKIKKIIKNSENLTLALDGWTNPNSDHHTKDFLAGQIMDIIKKIGSEKVFVLVTDNAANCVKAKEIVIN
ncbi:hypothetical protein RhiirC2_797494 [Rhizophagus irregularis]|uniref:DUF659 domain-containing protein n=1 Tax=Rhizophagus irregularis TaxID=588596 RepID=A0A2N1M7X9_9GLOM|nr:hypothetical protein RhiirC2_797494 [Rhizophagus irregularis]